MGALLVGSRWHQLDMIDAIDSTGLRPIIDRHFALADLVEAFQYEKSGGHVGKICVDI